VLTNLAIAGAILAATVTYPPNTGPVVDAAQVVPPGVEQRVEADLLDFAERTGTSVAVAVVSTTEPLEPDAYARELAREWGIITTPFDRAILLVVEADGRRAGLAVSLALAPTFDIDAQRTLLERSVTPHVELGDAADALEIGAVELRRALGDVDLPPPVSVVPPLDLPEDESDGREWPAVLFVLAAGALLLGSRFVVRRRRSWGLQAPVLWGTGWGRSVADPLAMWHRRYRRVRDAVPVAEAETGVPLCFWLGPAGDDAASLADDLFSRAAVEGHAGAVVVVATDRNLVELRIADWAGERLDGALTEGTALMSRVDALLTIATRIAATGAPVGASGGGVASPDLY
jgi:uncharacterized protein